METESCPGFQKARADWEALNKSQHDLFARETDPLFIHTLGRRWAAFCKCRTQECTWMIMWSALAINLTLLFLIFHDPRWLCLSWIFAAICFTAAFNCLILSIAQTIQFSSMKETFNAIEWVLAIRPSDLTPRVWWNIDILVLPYYFKICGDCHLEFHKDLPDQFYKLLKILMFLMRNMAMRKSWEGKAKKIISGSKPWDLY
ncbi:hypothetical protein K443DRAFT_123797 [Laccaria amethystina LaAM-08-1]|uniref:Uncharacterized protein n=1 Tax=Laccaria amethystina LaAM-08-1 TaxID=1095629 RepID=A0A0C9XQ42_9AGAR|nr:hypothetical protein K443DRAFT_123797 [Laccaria amethystina LaAM-08-1]